MGKIIDLIKKNWVSVLLLLVVIYLLGRSTGVNPISTRNSGVEIGGFADMASPMIGKSIGAPIIGNYQQAAPVVSDSRMVVQNTSISMQVNDVSAVSSNIENLAISVGGYMVNRSMVKPEGAATGNITIRVPAEKREETLNSIKKMGIKTVSENVSGYDVTDQYVDIQGRVDNLNKTKIKMEVLLDQANNVSDLMNIQMQINNIQSQIDSYIGQQKYLEQTAKLTRIMINLSTDELALPYVPDAAWRPGAVLKTAVRSMIGAVRNVADAIIWMVVYFPVLAIMGLLYYIAALVWKKFQPKI